MASSSQCTVCFEELLTDLSASPCGHVFHNFCIDKWRSIHPTCPICKAPLPPALLRLFYTADDSSRTESLAANSGSTNADASNRDSSMAMSVGGHGGRAGAQVSAGGGQDNFDSDETARLRVENASNTRVLEESARAIEGYKTEIVTLRGKLRDTKADSALAQRLLEKKVDETEGLVEKTAIDLSKKIKECSRLTRETGALQKQMEAFKSERRVNEYIAPFATRNSKVLNGLGQVSVEPIIEDVALGNTNAADVIRSQHALLSKNMDQQQKTLNSLRKTRHECDVTMEELETRRREVNALKRKAHDLKQALSHTRAEARDRSASGRSLGSRLDGTDRKQSGLRGTGGRAGSGNVDSGVGGGSYSDGSRRVRARVRPPGLSRPKEEDGCVSLEDDDDDDDFEEEEEDETAESSNDNPSSRKRTKTAPPLVVGWRSVSDASAVSAKKKSSAHSRGDNNPFARSALTAGDKNLRGTVGGKDTVRVARSESFGSGSKSGSGLEAGTRLEKAMSLGIPGPAVMSFRGVGVCGPASSRGKYIRTGYDAMGGRHSVATSAIRGLPDALQRKQNKGRTLKGHA